MNTALVIGLVGESLIPSLSITKRQFLQPQPTVNVTERAGSGV